MSAQDALNLGWTGPNLRASGVAYDVRSNLTYSIYDRFDFSIPVGSTGDVYDRIMVRFEEITQSLSIIRQALKQLPDGSVSIQNPRITLPSKQAVYGTIEGLMNQFKLTFEGVHVPKGEYYRAIEGANGELGFYIVSDGSGTPYRIKVRPPCFPAMAGYAKLVEGSMIADAILCLGSLNIVAGELDR
jgi:NADH-quinone oxidoreductase subunit C/D